MWIDRRRGGRRERKRKDRKVKGNRRYGIGRKEERIRKRRYAEKGG